MTWIYALINVFSALTLTIYALNPLVPPLQYIKTTRLIPREPGLVFVDKTQWRGRSQTAMQRPAIKNSRQN